MKFTAGEILSVATGRMSCGMDRIYKVLNFLTGDNLLWPQLPRAVDFCQKYVAEKYPWTQTVDFSWLTNETEDDWIGSVMDRFGNSFDLEPFPGWERQDPLDELREMMVKKSIEIGRVQ